MLLYLTTNIVFILVQDKPPWIIEKEREILSKNMRQRYYTLSMYRNYVNHAEGKRMDISTARIQGLNIPSPWIPKKERKIQKENMR